MLLKKETDQIRAYPTHQAVQTTGSTALKPDEIWEISYKDKPGSDEIISQVLVNFSGLCSLMLCSDSPVAEKFRRWLTQIVVPAALEEGQLIPIEPDLKKDLDNLGLLPF